jgi:predicted N-acetyltransferase YhbS
VISTRPEQPADIDAIRDLVRQAFTGHPVGRRFGFRRCSSGVTWPGVPDEYVLSLPFSTEEPVGEIAYHPAFLIGA